MINIRSDKGITIISLVITIIVLLILSGVTIHNINLSNGAGRYNNLFADIKLLKDETILYFNKYEEIPATNRKFVVDGVDYYEIDLSKLNSITLNYGKDYGKEQSLTASSDIYLVNEDLNIYYLKGIEKSGTIYHEL